MKKYVLLSVLCTSFHLGSSEPEQCVDLKALEKRIEFKKEQQDLFNVLKNSYFTSVRLEKKLLNNPSLEKIKDESLVQIRNDQNLIIKQLEDLLDLAKRIKNRKLATEISSYLRRRTSKKL